MTPIKKEPEELHPDHRKGLEDTSGINKNPPIRCKEKRRGDRQGGSGGRVNGPSRGIVCPGFTFAVFCVRTQSQSSEDLSGSGSTVHITGTSWHHQVLFAVEDTVRLWVQWSD